MLILATMEHSLLIKETSYSSEHKSWIKELK